MLLPLLTKNRQEGGTIDRRGAARRTHYLWVELLARDAVPAAKHEGASWDDLHAVLRSYNVWLEPAGSGARYLTRAWQRVKASDLGLGLRGLEAQLRPFCGATSGRADAPAARELRRRGCVERRRGRACIGSSRRSDLRARRRAAAGAFSILKRGGIWRSGRALRVLGGSKSGSVLTSLRPRSSNEARERERRETGIAERVERLREARGLVLDRLTEMRSVWNAADVEREVRSMLDGYDAAVGIATQAITALLIRKLSRPLVPVG